MTGAGYTWAGAIGRTLAVVGGMGLLLYVWFYWHKGR
jgi:hypothetical protein